MPPRPRFFLIDGHALAYRTYFALTGAGGATRFTTKAGEPTAGVYGFASVLLRLLTEETPEYLAVCFDTGRTFRDDIYPDYKATREKMPEDLVPQLNRIRQLVQAFGIPIFEKEGYEADDVLGAMAQQAAKAGLHPVIITGDRDLLQLSDENITIRLAGQKLSEAIDYTPKEVQKKFGVRPEQIVDFKALVGDSSDNIPGVRGIGEKTAVDLLQQYDSLDAIYQHLDEIPGRYRSKLIEQKEQAYMSKRLAQIVTDLPLRFEPDACRTRDYNRDTVVELFRELEFRTLLDRLPGLNRESHQMSFFKADQVQSKQQDTQDIIISNAEDLESLVRRLEDTITIAFDVETTSTQAMRADLVGISLAVSPHEGYYIPIGHHSGIVAFQQLEQRNVLQALRKSLTNPKIAKIGHNLKYDFILLARNGLHVAPMTFDTMLAEWLCDPSSRNLGLKNLAWVRLGIEMTEIEELIGSGRNQRIMSEVPVEKVAPYAIADARVCFRLMAELEKEIKEKALEKLFRDLEIPLIPILADMEMTGILLDGEFMKEYSTKLAGQQDEIETQIYRYIGHPFNINSTQQLSQVLFDELHLSPPDRTRRTASGHYSTAASVLDELKDTHPVIELILSHRELGKLKSTYVDALPQQINPGTGRIHTSYNQTGTVTGRIASSNPNLQNIPIRTDLGREIRRAFISAPGKILLSVDYSQIELRIVAHISEDQAMNAAFLADQDIHSATAAAIYNVPTEEVTAMMRRQAKAVNFGLIYGMSPYGLTRATDFTLAEAEDFVETYFQRFPGVRRYLDQAKQFAAERGYVETLLGRRRYFPELERGAINVSEQARSRAEREAINAPIQGTAADIIKIAMLRLPSQLDGKGLGGKMLLQVHDELVLECPQEELKPTAQLVKNVMQQAFQLRISLKMDAKAGPNWADMEAL